MKRFSQLIVLALGLCFFGLPRMTLAAYASCGVGGVGTCYTDKTCDPTSEVELNSLIVTFPQLSGGGSCAGSCCVPKGAGLCSSVSGLVGKSGYSCAGACTGTPLTSDVGAIGETCDGGSVCCSVPAKPDAKPKPVAATQKTGSSSVLINPLGAGTTVYVLLNRVISAFLGMVGAFALAVFVYAGITWMTAGSSDRIKQAQDAMKYAVMGLALIAFSYTITTFFLQSLTRQSEIKTPDQAPAVQATEFTQ